MATRLVLVDDTDPSIQYHGDWFADKGSTDNSGNYGTAYNRTLHGTRVNASLSFTFSGNQFFFLGYNNIRNDSGVVDPQWDCYLDGVQFKSKDAYQFPLNNWYMCEQLSIPDGQHTLTVNATVRNGQTFWFDHILYAPSASVPLEDKTVYIDAYDAEVEKAMQESKAWQIFGTTANMTTIPGTSFKFNFTGSALQWFGVIPAGSPHEPSEGSYAIDGDAPIPFKLTGLPPELGEWPPTGYNHKFFETPLLPPGNHSIDVVWIGDKTPLTVDYLVVLPDSWGVTSPPPAWPSPGAALPSGSSNNPSPSSSSSNLGAIVGGAVGGAIVVIFIIVGIFFYLRRRRNKSSQSAPSGDGLDGPLGVGVRPSMSEAVTPLERPSMQSQDEARWGPSMAVGKRQLPASQYQYVPVRAPSDYSSSTGPTATTSSMSAYTGIAREDHQMPYADRLGEGSSSRRLPPSPPPLGIPSSQEKLAREHAALATATGRIPPPVPPRRESNLSPVRGPGPPTIPLRPEGLKPTRAALARPPPVPPRLRANPSVFSDGEITSSSAVGVLQLEDSGLRMDSSTGSQSLTPQRFVEVPPRYTPQ